MKKRIFFLLLCDLYSNLCLAAVNVKTASFIEEVVDWKSSDQTVELRRRYNSRSLHMGFFGLGWCSSIERRLEVMADRQKLRIKSCWDQRDDEFSREGRVTDGEALFTRSGTSEIIFMRGHEFYHYHRESGGGLIEDAYDRQGRWIHQRMGGQTLTWEYSEGPLPRRMRWRDQAVSFGPTENGRWIQKIFAGGNEIVFRFEGLDLVRVEGDRDPTTYTYDSLHNLTEIADQRGRRVSINYDSREDRVVSVLNGSFVERYSYQIHGSRLKVTVLVENPKLQPLVTRYIFQRQDSESLQLQKVEMERGFAKMAVTYGKGGVWQSAQLRDGVHEWRMGLTVAGRVVAQEGVGAGAVEGALAQLQFARGGEL